MKKLFKKEKNLKSTCHCEGFSPWQSGEIASHSFAMTEQRGRSMVEILGVLAVIGVLSVAGIAGYSNAINKHRANELLNEASKRAAIVAMQVASGKNSNQLSVAEFGDNAWNVTTAGLTNQFGIVSPSVGMDVCKQVVNSVGTGTIIRKVLSGTMDATNNPDKCSDAAITLVFNNDMGRLDTTNSQNGTGGQENHSTCDDFTPTECIKSCDDSSGSAVYTYAKAGAYCSGGVCDGSGNIINVSDIEKNCPSGQVYFYDAGEYIAEGDCEGKRNATNSDYCYCECTEGPYDLVTGKCEGSCGDEISFNPITKECCPTDKPNFTFDKCVDCSQGEYKNGSCYCPDGVELLDTSDADCSNHLNS